MLDIEDRSAVQVLGRTDARKLRSSMTLFALADLEQPVFAAVLDKYYDGVHDDLTREILGLA